MMFSLNIQGGAKVSLQLYVKQFILVLLGIDYYLLIRSLFSIPTTVNILYIYVYIERPLSIHTYIAPVYFFKGENYIKVFDIK